MSQYKQGDVVRLPDGVSLENTKGIFLGMTGLFAWVAVESERKWETYRVDATKIQPWREPLTASFECAWLKLPINGPRGMEIVPSSKKTAEDYLTQFIGKRTHVVITEKLEGT